MKNILKAKPEKKLSGRLLYSKKFIKKNDLNNKNILDIGCGYGWCELNISNCGAKKIIGLDLSKENLRTAKNNINKNNIIFGVSNALNLPIKNESIDTIFLWEVIEHLPKDKENDIFKEINRVLNDSGVLYLSTPYKSFLSNILDPAWWVIKHRHYSTDKLIKFANDNILKPESIKVKGGIWSLLNGLNLYFSKWILRRKPIFQKYFIKKEEAEYKHNNGFANIFVRFRKISNL